MLRLLIVEDEKVVREALSRVVDWPQNGIELIGTCENGIEALDMIIDEYPDVVLTDIRMPGLDGLGLIERVQKLGLGTEFIILSGYGEFEYAKKAMHYGVREYLLKPCTQDQILEAITNAKEQITRQRETKSIHLQSAKRTCQFETAVRKQFTIEALTGNEDFSVLMTRYGAMLQFPKGEYHLYDIHFTQEAKLIEFAEWVFALLGKQKIHFCFNLLFVRESVLLMLCVDEKSDQFALEKSLDMKILDDPDGRMLWHEKAFDTVQSMLYELMFLLQQNNRIVLVDDDLNLHEIFNYVSSFRKMESAIEFLKPEYADSKIISVVEEVFTSVGDLDLARMVAMRLVAQSATESRLLNHLNIFEFMTTLYGAQQISEIRNYALAQLLCLSKEKSRTQAPYKDFVKSAIDYIDENLADPRISLKWLAENYLYMNVDYFSRQFVKETGEKFSSYLNRARIDKAKTLILELDSDLIYEVAEQVGYGHNPQYFSQLFKKWTGYTPSGYREQFA